MHTILFAKDWSDQKAIAHAGMAIMKGKKKGLFWVIKNRFEAVPTRDITRKTLDKHIARFMAKAFEE